eukprot:21115-Heterococcus_DN1.PRE.3
MRCFTSYVLCIVCSATSIALLVLAGTAQSYCQTLPQRNKPAASSDAVYFTLYYLNNLHQSSTQALPTLTARDTYRDTSVGGRTYQRSPSRS